MRGQLDHAERRTRLNASELGAIFGVDPWRTAGDVQASKIFEVEPDRAGEAAELGHDFEEALCRAVIRREVAVGEPMMQPSAFVPDIPLAATPDCVFTSRSLGTIVVEAKTHRLVGRGRQSEDWGEDGTDKVPQRVLFQTAGQLICVPAATHALVPALVPDFRVFVIPRDEEFLGMVAEGCRAWWRRHVIERATITDEGQLARPELLRRIKRTPNRVAQVPDDVALAYLEAGAARKRAEGVEEAAKARLLLALGDAEAGSWSGGQFTHFTQTRRGIDTEAVKALLGPRFGEVQKESSFPVLRHKAG